MIHKQIEEIYRTLVKRKSKIILEKIAFMTSSAD
jgi:hypothetical protein